MSTLHENSLDRTLAQVREESENEELKKRVLQGNGGGSLYRTSVMLQIKSIQSHAPTLMKDSESKH